MMRYNPRGFARPTVKGRPTVFSMVDNRNSGGGLLEMDVRNCPHCERDVILNPDRTRPRNHCYKCDAYICDAIECRLECVPFKKVVAEAFDAASKGKPLVLPARFSK